jgi:dTDP-4-amino-4,6-dideoxy-D-galactose acyltransferase
VVRAAQAFFLAQGVTEVTVVTQGRNIEAQRLYQKCGFLSRAIYYWYHKWFPTPGETTDGTISNPV